MSTRENAAQALEQLGRLALREHSKQSFLQAVVDLAKTVLPGDPQASITLLINDKPATAVFPGQLALDCDESQYGQGYGPCLHAASTGELTKIADMQAEDALAGLRAAGCRAGRPKLAVGAAADR